jgi:hypothetical protein
MLYHADWIFTVGRERPSRAFDQRGKIHRTPHGTLVQAV